MSTNRRSFIRNVALGSGAIVSAIPENGFAANTAAMPVAAASFNMCGYAAPKLPTVRVAVVGLGNRGPGAVDRLSYIDGVEIKALCDKYPERVDKAQKILTKKGLPMAKAYSGAEGWKAVCESNDIDLVYVTTPWELHTPISVYAMKNGKHAASEVPAAKTIDECWELVETSEKTKQHMMMLENCCYDFFELMTLKMAREGFFGDVVHVEGAYIHDLVWLNFDKDKGYQGMWRLEENFRNGNLYPTHGLGPICQILNINRGDQMDYLTSLSSNDFQMQKKAKELAQQDSFWNGYAEKSYRGNMNTTVEKTKLGKSIVIQHDVTSPRPYSRLHVVSGTEGYAQKYPEQKVAKGHSWMKEDEMMALKEKYTPEIVQKVGELAKQIGGHGGMDFMMDWRLIDCLRNGLPLDQDVYDAALWSCITPMSEWSVANRSNSIDIPDFTGGHWKTNAPVEITLKGGGTTKVRV